MLRILFYAQSAFTIWMLIDAVQRGMGYYWWAIIFFFPPVGPWIYFFMVKIHDLDTAWAHRFLGVDSKWLAKLFRQEPSIDELRYRHRINPCLENKVQLAKRLYDEKEYAEASSLFQEALQMDREDKEALYGSGLCKSKLGQFSEAIETLNRVVQMDRRFHNYAALEELARVCWMSGQKEETISMLKELGRTNPNLKNATLLANYLMQLQRKEEARQVLQTALDDYKNAPKYVKRTGWKWSDEARQMLKSM